MRSRRAFPSNGWEPFESADPIRTAHSILVAEPQSLNNMSRGFLKD
jgi:hypothetical protein